MQRSWHDRFLPALLCLPLGVLAAAVARRAVLLPWYCRAFMDRGTAHHQVFVDAGIVELASGLAVVCGICAADFLIASLLGLFRRRWTLALVRKTCVVAYVLGILYLYAVLRVTSAIRVGELEIDGVMPSAMAVAAWRWSYLWPAACVVLLVAALHTAALRRMTVAVYTGVRPDQPLTGDRIVENLRTHGRDPQYRKSLLTSTATHVLIIVMPLLLQLYGCVQSYLVPHGSGRPMVAIVQMVQRKRKKKKKFVLNPNSAIYFHVPDLDESNVLREVEQMTQLTYVADLNARAGKMGAGGGTKGGWPEGVGNEPVRFIRIEYRGRHWDDGMDKTLRADVNFLQEFRRQTGFKVARRSESHPIRLLKKYDKGFAPPFIYMTGDGGIHVPSRDLAVLREYLLDGGMLFADCGSPQWHRSFGGFAKALFPDKRLVVIADDDPIFQMPYAFPNGAPPLWHHGGMRALGIKHKGRWVVFYHPGDINDAWKSGHSGIRPDLAKGAFQMGINIIYYAFTHYLEETRKHRK